MPHYEALGITECGKTSLMKALARSLHRHGKRVAVLDPIGDEWACHFRTGSIRELHAWARRPENRSSFIFLDEVGRIKPVDSDHLEWFATVGRHYGHSCYFIAQRAPQIPRTVRDQCSILYLFTSSKYDSRIHADEWNKPLLINACQLPKLTFFTASRFGMLQLGTITDPAKGTVKLEEVRPMVRRDEVTISAPYPVRGDER